MQYLKQSAATVVEVGPFVDKTDGLTLEEAITVTNLTVSMFKHVDVLPADGITNGAFASDTGWTKGTNWQIGSGVADQSAPSASDLSQTPATALIEDQAYTVTYTVASRTAGAIVVKIGGTSGTSRSTNATFTEIIVAGSGALIEFTADGTWDGNIDDVTLEVSHQEITPAASGSANDMVFADGGSYYLELSAIDTGIPGRFKLVIEDVSDILPRTHEFQILPANVYDSMFGSDVLDVNVLQIDSDAVAPVNLKLMYNLAGYTDDSAPASRSQVDNIGAASGGAISFAPSSDNTSGAIIDGVTKVWATVSGTFANVANDDGTSHDFTDSGDVIDHVYGFAVGGGRQAVRATFKANVDGNNDTILLKAYDHVGSDWETIAVIEGSGGTVNRVGIPALFSKHTGTGAQLGNVYIRFDTDSTTPSDLSVSLLQVEAVNIGQTVGYANGRVFLDTVGGVAGTESFVNGVADNPTNLIASAKTIGAAVGLGDYHIVNGSTVTLTASSVNESYFGDNWTLALGGQTVTGAHFQGASVSGTHVGACEFTDCDIGNITTVANTELEDCHIDGTITLPAGDVFMSNCHHGGTAILDFGAAVGNTTVHMHKYAGAIELQNFGDNGTDILHLDGNGRLTINANSSGGTVHLRGHWAIANSASGVTINYDDQNTGYDEIPELALAVMPKNPTLREAAMYAYMKLRNKAVVNNTTNEATIANDTGTVIVTFPLTDDGSIYTKAKAT